MIVVAGPILGLLRQESPGWFDPEFCNDFSDAEPAGPGLQITPFALPFCFPAGAGNTGKRNFPATGARGAVALRLIRQASIYSCIPLL